jgi:hypothetical protein
MLLLSDSARPRHVLSRIVMPRALLLVCIISIAGCTPINPPPLRAPDPYEADVVEEHSITEPPPLAAEGTVRKGRLWRFELDRGSTRNGAGFAAIARQTPGGGRVVAFEFDGALLLGPERHEAPGFGGVAIVAFDGAGKLSWSRRLDTGKYHYIKALEVAGDGDILVGGAFGERGMALVRLSPDGQERWRLQPDKEPPWSEVSSLAVGKDGSIAAVGIFQKQLALPGVSPLSSAYFDGYVAKVDGQSGRILWIEQLSSPETKISAVYVNEAGHVVAIGDFRRELKSGKKLVRGKSDYFVARFSAQGALELLEPISLGWAGRVQRAQPMASGRVAVHVQGTGRKNALIGVSETNGGVVWKIEDGAGGAVLGTDEQARPGAVLYGVHDTEPSFGSRTMRLREIDGGGKVVKSAFLDGGPYLFITSGHVHRSGDGVLVSGSLRDQRWDNDGFYPYLLDIPALEVDMNLIDMTAIGRGTGTRCQESMPAKLVWKDVRVAVNNKLGELHACDADLKQVGARFELEPGGTVTGVEILGKAGSKQATCLQEALMSLRVCPFEGGPRSQKLGKLE